MNITQKAFTPALTQLDIQGIKQARQRFSDCYLCTVLEALSSSENGTKHILNTIKNIQPGYKDTFECMLYNPGGKPETFNIQFNHYLKYRNVDRRQDNPIFKLFDMLMGEYIEKHPAKKPLASRIATFLTGKSIFEFNKPSTAFHAITGIQPFTIKESSLNFNLKSEKNILYNLFEKLGCTNNENFSFVAGTGFRTLQNFKIWHCYVLKKINLNSKTVILKNKTNNEFIEVPFNLAAERLKFITGYFNEDLK